ncbi:TRAP transporter substrate-binding protein [Roseococcus sp. SDR]|uniref:TRAP transporter substrate-binding protein n=1 Tax=Roseococcus sp. SDR TaxID=2835532 RepID=UPI001BCD6A8D|nr:TRAP transporter substrate-binding protein [Roseococcus sp. SDR]MBS7789454.1 TRAP transporter substrate-binding protein [Roseococcus sp. SDR]MBV1844768.1 TRAP transporter substrate-binding protein [Roseococcus sp. SDR]
MLWGAAFVPAQAQPAPIQLKIVGGLAGVAQFDRYEVPFWLERVPRLTGGRVQAEIAAFDRSGIRGNEFIHLMRVGVVPFGTLILTVAGADEPELTASDLAALNPDMAHLRRNVEAFRPVLTRILRQNHHLEVLAVYAYPAQVLFCTRPFTGLGDIVGRRVRTSSATQADLMEAVGAIPVVIPFADIVSSIRRGAVECAVTGTLSGNSIGLHEVTSHVHAMALSWGVSVFAAHGASWAALPDEVRTQISTGLAALEAEIWTAAEQDTLQGLRCNAGQADCVAGQRGRMRIVPVSAVDEEIRRRLVRQTVLPRWLERCGDECARTWNETLGISTGIEAGVPAR